MQAFISWLLSQWHILMNRNKLNWFQEKIEERTAKYFKDLRDLLIENDSFLHLVDDDFTINNAIVDPNLTRLKDKIFEVAKTQQYWGELIPARWITLEKAMIELRCEGFKVGLSVYYVNNKFRISSWLFECMCRFLSILMCQYIPIVIVFYGPTHSVVIT